MGRLKRPPIGVEAVHRNREQVARLGREVRGSRRLRAWTQTELGRRIGLSQSAISLLERGLGSSLSVDTWQRVFVALGRRLVLDVSRDAIEETADAGHLAMQELVIRTARVAGYRAGVELPTRPLDARHSVDVGLRDDRQRRLIVVECWNSFGDVGASCRSTDRKLAEAEQLTGAWWGEATASVHGVWVVRATARNRHLVARYPELFAARFPGSSQRWLRALAIGGPPPRETGLIWCDTASTRLYAWRRSI